MEQRTELWHEQSLNPAPEITTQVKALSDRINRLWAEARRSLKQALEVFRLNADLRRRITPGISRWLGESD